MSTTHTHTYILYTHIHAFVYTCYIDIQHIWLHMYTFILTHMSIQAIPHEYRICAHTHIYIYYVYIYMHIIRRIHTHIYIYIYTYMCTHTYIYIYTQNNMYMCAPTEWAKFVHLWRRSSVASPRLTMRPSPAQRQSGTPQPRTNSCDRSSQERVENWRREDVTWNPVLYIMLCQKRSHSLYYIMIYNGYILLLDHVMFWCLNIFSSRPGLREMDLARRKLGTTMATLQHHFTTLSLETWMNLGWKRIEPAWTLDEHWITKYEHCMNNDHGWQLDKHGGTWTGGQTKITWVWVKN